MRTPWRMSYMAKSDDDGCLGNFIVLMLLIFCFPLGLIAIFIYGNYCNTSKETKEFLWKMIYVIPLIFILVVSPIICIISLFKNVFGKQIILFWIFTIIDLFIGYYFLRKKYKK